jgi:Flp pilus assembly pilin Flp
MIVEVGMMNLLKSMLMEDDGAAATEYAIMLGLILIVVVSTVVTLGTKTNSAFNNTASLL